MKTKEALQLELELLNKQQTNTYEKIEEIQTQMDIIDSEGLFPLLKGSEWETTQYSTKISLIYGKDKSIYKNIETYIDKFKIYPHGSHCLTEYVNIGCNDSEIYLSIDVPQEVYEKKEAEYIYQFEWEKLTEFAIQHGLIINFDKIYQAIEHNKNSVMELEQRIFYLKALLKKGAYGI
jgi:hypothetical protein